MKKLPILALLLALATGFAAQPDTAAMRLSEKIFCSVPRTINTV